MDDKQQVLVYVKDLEKIAALIDDLAWEIDRVGSSGVITYNDLALSMEELMVEYPDGVPKKSPDGRRYRVHGKQEVFWTEKRKLAKNGRGTN